MSEFRSRKHTKESLNKLAEKRGWEFLSKKYNGGNVLHNFKCDKGHKIKKTVENFLRGINCAICSKKAPLTISDFRLQAQKNKWELLSKTYSGKTEILQFKCLKCNNYFPLKSSYLRGDKKTKNCPYCSPLRKKTIDEIKKEAINLGFECISNQYNGILKKLMWRCKSKHEWPATPNDIFNNESGCPECRYHKNEAKIKFIFEEYFGLEFRKKSKIKTNSGKLIELDGYNSSLQLAFEYDGIQHYKYVPFFHKNNIANFKIQQLSDSLKTKYCKENGIHLIRIPYTVQNDELANYIISKFPAKSEKDLERIISIINSYGKNSNQLNPIRKELAKKGLELISDVYTMSTDKNLIVKCNTCQYTFTTNKNNIFKNNGCGKCSGVFAFSMEDIKKIALDNSLALISKSYNPGEKIIWKHSCGHVWSALPSTIKGTKNKKGTNCPECFGKKTSTIEDAIKLALSRGHKCLSKKMTNRDSLLNWQCKKRKDEIHNWSATFNSYKKSKNGCRYCTGKEIYILPK